MYNRDIKVWVWNSVMYETSESHVTECMTRLEINDKHKDMIIA
jgi:hypothetical protein